MNTMICVVELNNGEYAEVTEDEFAGDFNPGWARRIGVFQDWDSVPFRG